MYSFEPYEDGIRLTCFHGEEETIAIPSEIDGKPVRALGSRMFYDSGMAVQKIIVPGTVRSLEQEALEGCFGLRDLVLSAGLEHLGREFAAMTDLKSVHVPASVKQIDDIGILDLDLILDEGSPYYCSDGYGVYGKREDGYELLGVSSNIHPDCYAVKDRTLIIRKDAFHNAHDLKKVILPLSLWYIEEGALQSAGLWSLSKRNTIIYETKGNSKVFHQDGCLMQKKQDGVEVILYEGHEKQYMVPSYVSEIGTAAYKNAGITDLAVPSGVKVIHKDAFFGCPLKQAELACYGYQLIFPRSGTMLGPDLVNGFGRNGKFYDFAYYDSRLGEGLITADRVRMMVHRLSNPLFLAEDSRRRFQEILVDNLEECVRKSALEQDYDSVQGMIDLCIIRPEDADACIQVCEEAGSRECTARLIQAFAGMQEDDFDL